MRLKKLYLLAILTTFTLSGSLVYSDLSSVVHQSTGSASFDLSKVFQSCPVIYTILLLMSSAATVIWIYSLLTLKLDEMMPSEFTNTLRQQLMNKQFEESVEYCQNQNNFASHIIASGLTARNHGPQVVMDIIQSEGRRAANTLWQRIGLLNDIAVIAPMLGLLGTVLGLFFAFYDSSSTTENISSIFDGLGIAIGTTVLGLIVAILAMIYHTSLKYRVVYLLNSVENESLSLVNLIESENNHYKSPLN